MVTKIHRKLPRWVPVVAGAAAVAAVVLVLASLPRCSPTGSGYSASGRGSYADRPENRHQCAQPSSAATHCRPPEDPGRELGGG